jgi:hypothetical protein
MKKFIIVIGILVLVVGQIYLCEFTQAPKYICFITPIFIAAVCAIAVGGLKESNKTDKDAQTGIKVTAGVFALMTLITYLVTILAINER